MVEMAARLCRGSIVAVPRVGSPWVLGQGIVGGRHPNGWLGAEYQGQGDHEHSVEPPLLSVLKVSVAML